MKEEKVGGDLGLGIELAGFKIANLIPKSIMFKSCCFYLIELEYVTPIYNNANSTNLCKKFQVEH